MPVGATRWSPIVFVGPEFDWRTTQVKVKVSSSSLAKRRRKAGEIIEGGSGSFAASAYVIVAR